MISSGKFLVYEIKSFEDMLENIPERQIQVMENQHKQLKDEAEYEIKDQIKPFKHILEQPLQALITPYERIEKKPPF
jgi:hypothetical protein